MDEGGGEGCLFFVIGGIGGYGYGLVSGANPFGCFLMSGAIVTCLGFLVYVIRGNR